MACEDLSFCPVIRYNEKEEGAYVTGYPVGLHGYGINAV